MCRAASVHVQDAVLRMAFDAFQFQNLLTEPRPHPQLPSPARRLHLRSPKAVMSDAPWRVHSCEQSVAGGLATPPSHTAERTSVRGGFRRIVASQEGSRACRGADPRDIATAPHWRLDRPQWPMKGPAMRATTHPMAAPARPAAEASISHVITPDSGPNRRPALAARSWIMCGTAPRP